MILIFGGLEVCEQIINTQSKVVTAFNNRFEYGFDKTYQALKTAFDKKGSIR